VAGSTFNGEDGKLYGAGFNVETRFDFLAGPISPDRSGAMFRVKHWARRA
jgi:hypothetical protein